MFFVFFAFVLNLPRIESETRADMSKHFHRTANTLLEREPLVSRTLENVSDPCFSRSDKEAMTECWILTCVLAHSGLTGIVCYVHLYDFNNEVNDNKQYTWGDTCCMQVGGRSLWKILESYLQAERTCEIRKHSLETLPGVIFMPKSSANHTAAQTLANHFICVFCRLAEYNFRYPENPQHGSQAETLFILSPHVNCLDPISCTAFQAGTQWQI